MGATKSDQFSDHHNEMSALLKALAHPARVAIVEYLLKVESCICSDIVDHLPLAQPTVSQHLRELKNAGIIQGAVEGTSICYCLNEKALVKLKNYFGKLESKVKSKCC